MVVDISQIGCCLNAVNRQFLCCQLKSVAKNDEWSLVVFYIHPA